MPKYTDEVVVQALKSAFYNVVECAYRLRELMTAQGEVLDYRAWLLDVPSFVPGEELPTNRTHIGLSELVGYPGLEILVNHYCMTEIPSGTAANHASRVVGIVKVSEDVIACATELNNAKMILREVESKIPAGSRRKLRKRILPPRHHMTYAMRKISIFDEPLERLRLGWEGRLFSQESVSPARVTEIINDSRWVNRNNGKDLEQTRQAELNRLGKLGDNVEFLLRKPVAPSVFANGKLESSGAYRHWRLSTPLMTTQNLPETIGPGHFSKAMMPNRKERKDKKDCEKFIEPLGIWFREKPSDKEHAH